MNTIRQQLDTFRASRQARLNGWLAERGIQKSSLAEATGVSLSYMSHILAGKRQPGHVIRRLVDLGIPADLLPEPAKNGKSKKTENQDENMN